MSAALAKIIQGSLIHVPKKDSRVYFFPQGYLEQALNPVSLSSIDTSRSFVECRVLDRSFYADTVTDEVFVKFRLMPLKSSSRFVVEGSGSVGNGDDGVEEDEESENVIESFVKSLTASDANNGGGFSVPRYCAESIFPALNFEDDPPVQNLRIFDVHGVEWPFRHIYRGTPRRHLLTSGWSKFVNSKNLVANDCAVFIKNKVTGQLFVGIRRAFKPLPKPNARVSSWVVLPPPKPRTIGVFSRNVRGRVPEDAIVDAIQKAASNVPFEVVYYSRGGLPEFVVAAEKVEEAWGVFWNNGIRVKMARQIEDGGPKPTWFNGTVASVVPGPDQGPWPGSPWRMLQVAWDEADKMEEFKMLSPWQLECIAPTPPPIHPTFNPGKKLKGVQNSVMLADGKGDISFPPIEFGPMMMGPLSPSFINYNNFPAGMQGARQFPSIYLPSSSTTMNDSSHQGGPDDNMDSSMSQKVEGVSTNPNVASSSCETPSPDSHNSVQLFGSTSTGRHSCNVTRQGVTSFQLFGKTIHMVQPLADTDDISCTECDAESQRPPVMKPSAM
uniref:Auxin response factor n=1 Tax=Chenopodium quinoa TaxID=63459 RepID=A0A803M578_CHEQI